MQWMCTTNWGHKQCVMEVYKKRVCNVYGGVVGA